MADRLSNIRDVADDLTREFIRLQCAPRNVAFGLKPMLRSSP
jgi:hypothetical protein